MPFDTTATTLAGESIHVIFDNTPDICPICHRNIQPKYLAAFFLDGRNKSQAIFRCTNQKCQELFLANYKFTGNKTPHGHYKFDLDSLAPLTSKPTIFAETIIQTSPTFIQIYAQAIHAEAQQLDQLVGIGLRKALEFLIKDFAAIENPGSEEGIRKATLSQCIENYISDTNVKECAKRAVWLGNDETHYIRKWETKDINDLKLLVHLTVNWIDNTLLTKKYVSEMSI